MANTSASAVSASPRVLIHKYEYTGLDHTEAVTHDIFIFFMFSHKITFIF